ncbi:hypothetical protein EGR_09080 [Echinococcus granulosus]|uniref:Uncharacterized protein n=1 Tax=Echinococcus granulosus TaxID=6210 RepID=W6U4Q6_ECHGR|nr:hypothetical protein EGR_09080 [Echinococcus granulosus]EUB56090.1 hypothetical protein EGR_09080 [Echinococcus granulosus]
MRGKEERTAAMVVVVVVWNSAQTYKPFVIVFAAAVAAAVIVVVVAVVPVVAATVEAAVLQLRSENTESDAEHTRSVDKMYFLEGPKSPSTSIGGGGAGGGGGGGGRFVCETLLAHLHHLYTDEEFSKSNAVVMRPSTKACMCHPSEKMVENKVEMEVKVSLKESPPFVIVFAAAVAAAVIVVVVAVVPVVAATVEAAVLQLRSENTESDAEHTRSVDKMYFLEGPKSPSTSIGGGGAGGGGGGGGRFVCETVR